MEKLMTHGWRFEFYLNDLDSYSCRATKGNNEVICDNFGWWLLVCDVVRKCDEIDQKTEQMALWDK